MEAATFWSTQLDCCMVKASLMSGDCGDEAFALRYDDNTRVRHYLASGRLKCCFQPVYCERGAERRKAKSQGEWDEIVTTGQWKSHQGSVRYKSKAVDKTECHTLLSDPPSQIYSLLALEKLALRHTGDWREQSLSLYSSVNAVRPNKTSQWKKFRNLCFQLRHS